MTKLPVKIEFLWNKKGSYKERNPFTISFVYPINNKPFCLKGGFSDIKDWLDESMASSYIVYHTTFGPTKRKIDKLINRLNPSEKKTSSVSKKIIDVCLESDCYTGEITKNKYRGKLTSPKKSYTLRVIKRDKSNKFIMMERDTKRPPRCFPKQFVPYCNDHKLYEVMK